MAARRRRGSTTSGKGPRTGKGSTTSGKGARAKGSKAPGKGARAKGSKAPGKGARAGSTASGKGGRARASTRGGQAAAARPASARSGKGAGRSTRRAATTSPRKAAATTEDARPAKGPRALVATIPVEVGRVVHVYPRAGAAVVALTGELRAGDAVAVRGATTDFCALAERLEREGRAVEVAAAGEQIGVALPERAREGDRVYRLSR